MGFLKRRIINVYKSKNFISNKISKNYKPHDKNHFTDNTLNEIPFNNIIILHSLERNYSGIYVEIVKYKYC